LRLYPDNFRVYREAGRIKVYFILDWVLTCTAGDGRCGAALRVKPPARYTIARMNDLPATGKRKNIPNPFAKLACSGNCEKETSGAIEIFMNAPADVDAVPDVDFSLHVSTSCAKDRVIGYEFFSVNEPGSLELGSTKKKKKKKQAD
jgi:hypothetical protein